MGHANILEEIKKGPAEEQKEELVRQTETQVHKVS